MTDHIPDIVNNFQIKGNLIQWHPYGSGHIHNTFLIEIVSTTTHKYLLQRINHQVFNNVKELMHNIVRITNHLKAKIDSDLKYNQHWQYLTIIPTEN